MICCEFCLENWGETVKADFVAPQFKSGHETNPIIWLPVCKTHFDGWFDDVGIILPYYVLHDHDHRLTADTEDN